MIAVPLAQIVQTECTAVKASIGLSQQRVQCKEPHLMSVKLIMNVKTINFVGMQARPLKRLEVKYV